MINLKVRPSAEDGLGVVCKRRVAAERASRKAPRSGRSSADNGAVDVAAVDVRSGSGYGRKGSRSGRGAPNGRSVNRAAVNVRSGNSDGASKGRRCSRRSKAERRLKRRELRGKLAALDYLIGVVGGQRVFCAEVSSRGVRDSDDSLLAGRCPSVYFPLSDFR